MELARFEQFVAQYQSIVCAVAYSATGDRALSEDVAQEALLIAWRKLPELGEEPHVPSWMRAIVRRVAANARRKRRREVADADRIEGEPTREPGPLDALLSREADELAARALAELAEKYREPIVLYYRGERSVSEVAAVLGISEEVVRQRLSRGRKALKERFARVEHTLRATAPGTAFRSAVVVAWGVCEPSAAAGSVSCGLLAPGVRAGLAVAAAVALVVPLGVWWSAGAATETESSPALAGSAFAAHTVAFPLVTPPEPTNVAAARLGRARDGRPGGVSHPAQRSTGWKVNRAGNARSSAFVQQRQQQQQQQHEGMQKRIDLDLGQSRFETVLRLLSQVTDVPILLEDDITAAVNVRLDDVPAIEALDEVLAQAGAERTEIPAVRVGPGSADGAALLGGAPVTGSFADADLREVVRAIEPALDMPIVVGRGVEAPRVTIRFDGIPAGLALEQLLRQTGLGFETSFAFVVRAALDRNAE